MKYLLIIILVTISGCDENNHSAEWGAHNAFRESCSDINDLQFTIARSDGAIVYTASCKERKLN